MHKREAGQAAILHMAKLQYLARTHNIYPWPTCSLGLFNASRTLSEHCHPYTRDRQPLFNIWFETCQAQGNHPSSFELEIDNSI